MSDIEDMQKENDMDDNEPLSGGGGEVFDKNDWYHRNISMIGTLMKMMISMILVMMMIMIVIDVTYKQDNCTLPCIV